eukprot:CAMPEP_0178554954 /NCGR_PEP_ID=MMETSP0697-20121206/8608_1 /TAXON_ID=265572 /ORGANISM="Extubocellulus spinifer, Strain CCMP396" /LENGTH=578 /DNA_ID=CAMNT_0020187937 /DNA_START=100 /DNA_END=1836 /DNA_ORIENTATION=-
MMTTTTVVPPNAAKHLPNDEEAVVNDTTGTGTSSATDDGTNSSIDDEERPSDAEKRRQLVVDLAKRRVSKNKQTMTSQTPAHNTGAATSTATATSTIPIPSVVTPDKFEQPDTRSARTRRSKARIPVERSIEEVKEKMMMMQDDDADPRILPVLINNSAAAAAAQAEQLSSFTIPRVDVARDRSDIPWDERPTGLPQDVPSFDAGDSWDSSSRYAATPASPSPRTASPPAFCTPSPPPAPTNSRCKDKHFFGPDDVVAKEESSDNAPHDEPRSRSSTEDTRPTTASSSSNNNNNSNGSPLSNHKSISFEESGGGGGGNDDAAIREVTPPKVESTSSSSRKRIAEAKASRLRTLLNQPKTGTVDDEKCIDDVVGSEESVMHDDGDNVASSVHDGGNGSAESVHDEDQQGHDEEQESDGQHEKNDTNDLIVANDKASNAPSVAETSSAVGDAGCTGLFSNKSLILEFDRDIFGCMRDATNDAGQSHKVDIMSDDDEVSDISSLTGRWRRQARAMAEEQKRANALKAKEETVKEKHALSSSPFDCMAMVCGDLKALICEGIEGHHEEDGAAVCDSNKQASF